MGGVRYDKWIERGKLTITKEGKWYTWLLQRTVLSPWNGWVAGEEVIPGRLVTALSEEEFRMTLRLKMAQNKYQKWLPLFGGGEGVTELHNLQRLCNN